MMKRNMNRAPFSDLPVTACSVCGRPTTMVAASPLGPFTNAYCGDCVLRGAEPAGDLALVFDLTGGEVAAWVRTLTTYVDGQYLSWDEWLESRHEQK